MEFIQPVIDKGEINELANLFFLPLLNMDNPIWYKTFDITTYDDQFDDIIYKFNEEVDYVFDKLFKNRSDIDKEIAVSYPGQLLFYIWEYMIRLEITKCKKRKKLLSKALDQIDTFVTNKLLDIIGKKLVAELKKQGAYEGYVNNAEKIVEFYKYEKIEKEEVNKVFAENADTKRGNATLSEILALLETHQIDYKGDDENIREDVNEINKILCEMSNCIMFKKLFKKNLELDKKLYSKIKNHNTLMELFKAKMSLEQEFAKSQGQKK